MQDLNERPACHRAEDLVTYLYGEAGETEALDFRNHLQSCAACRNEFAVFNQVHESILLWRNEALGVSFKPSTVAIESPVDSDQAIRHPRRLSALAALREFFSVSPFWLRAATALSAVLLCVLAVLTVARLSPRPNELANKNAEAKYTRKDLDEAVRKGIDEKLAELNQRQPKAPETLPANSQDDKPRIMSSSRSQTRSRPRGLTLQERQQLAADLRLWPGADDDELPFGLSEEPNQ